MTHSWQMMRTDMTTEREYSRVLLRETTWCRRIFINTLDLLTCDGQKEESWKFSFVLKPRTLCPNKQDSNCKARDLGPCQSRNNVNIHPVMYSGFTGILLYWQSIKIYKLCLFLIFYVKCIIISKENRWSVTYW